MPANGKQTCATVSVGRTPPGTAWNATVTLVTASTDVNSAIYQGPAVGGLPEGKGFV